MYITVFLLKIWRQKINFKFSCRMFWRVSCKTVAESQNHRIIGGNHPSVSFQVWEQGCHVVSFLCSSSMSSPLIIQFYRVLWEPWVREGFFVLHDKENRHDKHTMVVYLDEELLVFIGHWPGTRDRRDLMCYFFTKHDGQIIGEATVCRVQWQSVRIQLTCGSAVFWII